MVKVQADQSEDVELTAGLYAIATEVPQDNQDKGPQIIESGSGIRVFDDNGKSYIEGMSGLWCSSLGFSEERLVEAAVREMRRLPYYHGFAHKTSDVTIDLAEKIVNLAL